MFLNTCRFIKSTLHNYLIDLYIRSLQVLPYNGEISLVDIGAAGEIEPRFKPYSQFLNYIGFEPDERSRNNIYNRYEFKNYQILPHALASNVKSETFNLCSDPQVSSLLEPNTNFIDRFPNPGRFDVIKKLFVECVPLDDIKISNIDFIKIDIQGAENNVLIGASSSLSSVLGLELEVEFSELYKNQFLFGDVCKTLNGHDLEFFDFVNICRWERNAHSGYGQCIFGDALFLRTPESMIHHNLDIKKWSAYLSILIIYKRFDLIEVALCLLPPEFASEFEKFKELFSYLKKREIKVRRIHSFINRFLSLLGASYRSHLIY
jgi:FkbM family methyltransferase